MRKRSHLLLNFKNKTIKKRNEIIKEAIRDFYGIYSPNAKSLMKYCIKTKKPQLTDEQKDDLWYIKQNLKDKTYRESIEKSLRG